MAQGLDRLLLIQFFDVAFDYANVASLVPLESYRVWGTRDDLTKEQAVAEGGVSTVTRRNYTVRWFRQLADAVFPLVAVTAEDGAVLRIVGIVELTRDGRQRHRFITIEAVKAT